MRDRYSVSDVHMDLRKSTDRGITDPSSDPADLPTVRVSLPDAPDTYYEYRVRVVDDHASLVRLSPNAPDPSGFTR